MLPDVLWVVDITELAWEYEERARLIEENPYYWAGPTNEQIEAHLQDMRDMKKGHTADPFNGMADFDLPTHWETFPEELHVLVA